MTIYEFIYMTGCGVAFLVAFYGFASDNKTADDPAPVEAIFFCSLLCTILSWSLPIFLIGKEIYERKVRK